MVIERDGTPVPAIVLAANLKRFDRLDREWAERTAAIEAMREPFRDVPTEEIERETARILARQREANFAVVDEVREAFKDAPPEEIERETDRIIARIRSESDRWLAAVQPLVPTNERTATRISTNVAAHSVVLGHFPSFNLPLQRRQPLVPHCLDDRQPRCRLGQCGGGQRVARFASGALGRHQTCFGEDGEVFAHRLACYRQVRR